MGLTLLKGKRGNKSEKATTVSWWLTTHYILDLDAFYKTF